MSLDFGSITDTKLSKAVFDLLEKLLSMSRHFFLDIVITLHAGMQGRKTKLILTHMSHLVLFPKGGATRQARRMLETYGNLGKDDIKKFLSLPPRWALLSTRFPNFVLGQQDCYLIDDSGVESIPLRHKKAKASKSSKSGNTSKKAKASKRKRVEDSDDESDDERPRQKTRRE